MWGGGGHLPSSAVVEDLEHWAGHRSDGGSRYYRGQFCMGRTRGWPLLLNPLFLLAPACGSLPCAQLPAKGSAKAAEQSGTPCPHRPGFPAAVL